MIKQKCLVVRNKFTDKLDIDWSKSITEIENNFIKNTTYPKKKLTLLKKQLNLWSKNART